MQGVMHRRKIPAWLRLLVFLCVLSLFVSLFSVLVSVFFPVLPALSLVTEHKQRRAREDMASYTQYVLQGRERPQNPLRGHVIPRQIERCLVVPQDCDRTCDLHPNLR